MEKLYLSQSTVKDILGHARAALPGECVGLLFGQEGNVKRRVPLTNVAESKGRYFADPTELFAALREGEAEGDDLLAIYHSHPNARQTPSETDIKEVRYDAAHLIVVPQSGVLRAFTFSGINKSISELDVIVLRGEPLSL